MATERTGLGGRMRRLHDCARSFLADMLRDAIQRRASFNVVYLATMFKADVFILQGNFVLTKAV